MVQICVHGRQNYVTSDHCPETQSLSEKAAGDKQDYPHRVQIGESGKSTRHDDVLCSMTHLYTKIVRVLNFSRKNTPAAFYQTVGYIFYECKRGRGKGLFWPSCTDMGVHAVRRDLGFRGRTIRGKIMSEWWAGHREERFEIQGVRQISWIVDDLCGTRRTSTYQFSRVSLSCSKRRWSVVVGEVSQSHGLYIFPTPCNIRIREGVFYKLLVAVSPIYDQSRVRHHCSPSEGVELSNIAKRLKSDRRRTFWAQRWPSHGYLRGHINERNIQYVGIQLSDVGEMPLEGNFEALRRSVPLRAYLRCCIHNLHGGERILCRRR